MNLDIENYIEEAFEVVEQNMIAIRNIRQENMYLH